MKTIEEFFGEVEAFKNELGVRDSKTIHTNEYEETTCELYADWQQAKISLKPFIDQNITDSMDEQFTGLLKESRKSQSSVSASTKYLRDIEDKYVEHVYPEISHRNIEAGFVNSLVAELEQIEEDKYHDYMEEAVQCVQAGAYRGAVVLGWQGGMYALYQKLKEHDEPIHVVYQKKFGTKPNFKINSFWNFQKITDKNILILCESIGLIDKSLMDMLDREKDIRNKAAHPGVYDVGPNGTKALLEAIMQLLMELRL